MMITPLLVPAPRQPRAEATSAATELALLAHRPSPLTHRLPAPGHSELLRLLGLAAHQAAAAAELTELLAEL